LLGAAGSRAHEPPSFLPNALKIFWGADGNVTGARRFHAFIGAVMVVHLVFATLLAKAPRWEGTLSHTRLGPIAQALNESSPQ
jgi:hypothetical protein